MRANRARYLDIGEIGTIAKQRCEDFGLFQTLQDALCDHQHSLLVRIRSRTHLMSISVSTVKPIVTSQIFKRYWLYCE